MRERPPQTEWPLGSTVWIGRKPTEPSPPPLPTGLREVTAEAFIDLDSPNRPRRYRGTGRIA